VAASAAAADLEARPRAGFFFVRAGNRAFALKRARDARSESRLQDYRARCSTIRHNPGGIGRFPARGTSRAAAAAACRRATDHIVRGGVASAMPGAHRSPALRAPL